MSTLAGGTYGFADGAGSEAQFKEPTGVAADSRNGNVYVADYNSHRIRKVTADGTVSTLAGTGTAGHTNGAGSQAQFSSPKGVAVDSDGNVYVADRSNNRIRKITAGGTVSTLAGTATAGFADTGTDTSAQFNNPYGVAVDSSGIVYVADYGNNRIRKITITVTVDGTTGAKTETVTVSTLAGDGTSGSTDGAGNVARFSNPKGVAVDSSGIVYVADYGNNHIRKVTANGTVSTLAGSGTYGFANGTGSTAQFRYPEGVAVDSSSNVYVADRYNNRIRKVTAEGEVSTLAGGTYGFADGAGSSAKFNQPLGVAVDSSGKIYVGDTWNHRIRKIEYKVP